MQRPASGTLLGIPEHSRSRSVTQTGIDADDGQAHRHHSGGGMGVGVGGDSPRLMGRFQRGPSVVFRASNRPSTAKAKIQRHRTVAPSDLSQHIATITPILGGSRPRRGSVTRLHSLRRMATFRPNDRLVPVIIEANVDEHESISDSDVETGRRRTNTAVSEFDRERMGSSRFDSRSRASTNILPPQIGLIPLTELRRQLEHERPRHKSDLEKWLEHWLRWDVLPCCGDDDESLGHQCSILLVALLSFSTFICCTIILIAVYAL